MKPEEFNYEEIGIEQLKARFEKLSADYEALLKAAGELETQHRIDNEIISQYKSQLDEAQKEVTFLRGKVEAFEFCIAEGDA